MFAIARRFVPIVGVAASGLVVMRRRWWASVVVKDLLGADGGPTSAATAINPAGVVVGVGSGRAFRWNGEQATWLTELGVGSRANAIDADASIAGARFIEDDDLHPVRWNPDGEVEPLALPKRGWVGTATGVAGSVTVGWCAGPGRSLRRRAWIWSDGHGEELPVDGGAPAEASAVNHAGMVVGSTHGAGSTIAHLWDQSAGLSSPLLGLGGQHTRALACTDRGSIVGYATSPTGDDQACIWSDTTEPPMPLPTLGGAGARALAVSGSGSIAGWSIDPGGHPHACVWEPESPDHSPGVGSSRGVDHGYTVHDLGTLGGQTSEAIGINDVGAVVGTASRGRGALSMPIRPGGWSWEDRAFLTTLDDHRR